MLRTWRRAGLVVVLAGLVSGCRFGPWGGPAYYLNLDKIGTGESVFERCDGSSANMHNGPWGGPASIVNTHKDW